MSYTGDPANSVTDRVRLCTGDADILEEGLTDEVYEYLLDKHNDDEALACLEALRYLVAKYANYVDEKTGGIFLRESDKYDHYKDLLDRYTKDPSYIIGGIGLPFAGGISISDKEDNCANPDVKQPTYFDDGQGCYNYCP